MRYSKFMFVTSALALIVACSEARKAGDSKDVEMSDSKARPFIVENDLLLHKIIKPGMRFEDIDSIFQHKEIELEVEVFGDNYQEATISYEVLNRNGFINFNFQDSIMYSFYYELDSIDGVEGDSLYAGLQNLYKKEFPDLKEEVVNEGNHHAVSTYWKRPDFEYVLTYNINSRSLSWGIQERK